MSTNRTIRDVHPAKMQIVDNDQRPSLTSNLVLRVVIFVSACHLPNCLRRKQANSSEKMWKVMGGKLPIPGKRQKTKI